MEAVLDMPVPGGVQDIQRLVGFVIYLSRYLPSLSDVLECQLTRPAVPWHWAHTQQEALDQVKRLASYNPKSELVIRFKARPSYSARMQAEH